MSLQARETGNFPAWFSEDQISLEQRRLQSEYDATRREAVIRNIENEVKERDHILKQAYDVDNVRAAIEERKQRDRMKPSEILRKAAAYDSMRFILHEKEKEVSERLKKREKQQSKVIKEEAFRLIDFANNLSQKLNGKLEIEDV